MIDVLKVGAFSRCHIVSAFIRRKVVIVFPVDPLQRVVDDVPNE
jgi:hypothetical protein